MQPIIIALVVLYGVVVTVVNRRVTLGAETVDFRQTSRAKERLPDDISVSTWNVGYAGLGRASDFVVDGGQSILPPSRAVVDKNIAGIVDVSARFDTHVQFYQEVSYAGLLSRWKSVATALSGRANAGIFWWRPDIATRFLPWPLRLQHGTVIATDMRATSGALIPLVGDPQPLAGFLNRQYGMQVLKMTGADDTTEWAFINIHLSAFDGAGVLRRRQVDAVFDYAQTLFTAGFHVVIGGDWNLKLIETDFPHQTHEDALFWLQSFPDKGIPEGWRLAIDPALPTVRTCNQPFVRGENYLAIIDGFAVSPNVQVVSVRTTDTDFEMSDHMPVTAVFRAKRKHD